MKQSNVNVAVIRVTGDNIGLNYKNIGNNLQSFYNEIGCSLIDMVRNVKIGGSILDIIVDDEGLLKDNATASGCCLNAPQILVGNAIVVRIDDEGNITDLTESDMSYIEENVRTRFDEVDGRILPVLVYTL